MTPLALSGAALSSSTVVSSRRSRPSSSRRRRRRQRTGRYGGPFLAEASGLQPAADTAHRIDYVRDPERLQSFAARSPDRSRRFYLDLPAGPAGELPQGGETVIEFPNNHLGYAITWFGFALLVPPLLILWVRRQRRVTAKP